MRCRFEGAGWGVGLGEVPCAEWQEQADCGSSPMSALRWLGACERIQGAADSPAAHPEHVRVDHGRGDIGMAEQLLHCADVTPALQQVRREAVPQRVRRGGLGDAGTPHGPLEGPLEGFIVEMVARHYTTSRVSGMTVLRKDPEPGPARTSARLLPLQRIRHLDAGAAFIDISLPHLAAGAQLCPERG